MCLLPLIAHQPATLARTVQLLEEHCEHLQQGFRELVHDLYPVALQHLPMAEAFAMLVTQWRASHGIDCQLQVSDALPPLSPANKTHLYRLLQEALQPDRPGADGAYERARRAL